MENRRNEEINWAHEKTHHCPPSTHRTYRIEDLMTRHGKTNLREGRNTLHKLSVQTQHRIFNNDTSSNT